ncbi:AAA domain-containing protein [Proteus mirabilis]|uniref:5-methylcytosine-specific restriction enzyme B n=2 Tax=Proteus mirabilis TaxID=584 RepID=A0A379GBW3_PROMI|nr:MULTISPECIES: AAA family ATPase [Proteus]ARX09958.1 restriction endonuclease [Proteus mirabilis]EEI47466.1 ATPase family associated with various cellular activities (AAA) [Proteus mirabilis ATCC 29906]EGT0657704.1 AAA domain-containing protein [Proteus mirabilis]EGT0659810.1 AAA domain-containing protein [Proteus mirabilis]EHZ8014980.1 AAA family ATPase [Proteus mirabilis]
MKSRLKNLYKYLIENRKHEVNGWHKAYRDFYSQVAQIRERITSGEGLSQNDEAFLKQLIYEKSNGIASRGQSVLSNDNFQSFIKNKNFISALEKFILIPNSENFTIFSDTWSNQGKSNNPVLVNRVAAACTLEVSTTVDSGKFNQVFNWLIREGIIPVYPTEENQSWFAKNIFLLKSIKSEFDNELREGKTDEFYLSQFVWVLYENLSNPFSLKKQIIKYGAPGTGKTYQARLQTSLMFDIWKEEFTSNSRLTHASQIELVQFHPSFSYEDFMEGLRPVLGSDGNSQLRLQNGVFKEFCRSAGKWEIDVYGLGLAQKWESLTIKELLPFREKLSGEHWRDVFEISDTSKLVSEAVPPFFFIIDEVNRAELSRVFGELMYCLEYRGTRGCVKTQYANLNNEHTGMLKDAKGYLFFIPTNIYLIGTMNTIDRSVESFDFALRRRFRWEEVVPDMALLKYHLNQFCKAWLPLVDNLERLNELIAKEPLLGNDYQIGHAYLMDLKYATSLTVSEVRERVWDDCIRPLLQEYLRGTGKETELISSFGKAFGV